MRRATRYRCPVWRAGRGVERGKAPRRAGRPAVRRREPGAPCDARGDVVGRRHGSGGLVDLGDLVRHMPPREALRRLAGRLAHRGPALRLEVEALELLGEPLRIGGWNEDAVDAVAHDLGVPGYLGGHDGSPGGEPLDQDHSEALAVERGGTQDVGLVQGAPQRFARDPAEGIDVQRDLRVGEVARDVVSIGADHGEARGKVADQLLEGRKQDREALALLGASDEDQPQLLRVRLGARGRRIDVDAVGDDPVIAAEPPPAGPCGRLRYRYPRLELVHLAARAEQVPELVRNELGRVRVERPDHRRVGERDGVPAQKRCDRLVNVDHVEASGAKLATHRGDCPGGRRQVGDGAVRAEADRAAERDQVVGARPLRGRRAVQHAAEAVRRVPRGEHSHVVTAGQELVCERLDVAVHAPFVGPGIRRHEGDPHQPILTMRSAPEVRLTSVFGHVSCVSAHL